MKDGTFIKNQNVEVIMSDWSWENFLQVTHKKQYALEFNFI